MNQLRLDQLLERFSDLHVLVVGDFFLDKYLIIDRQLSKASLETGLEAYQVVDIRYSPGVAGTVTSNLRGLGVGVTALGVIGQDGQGYELKRGLVEAGVGIEYLLERPDLFTPTYTKPMVRKRDGREHEIQRLDIKNRSPLKSLGLVESSSRSGLCPSINDIVWSWNRRRADATIGVVLVRCLLSGSTRNPVSSSRNNLELQPTVLIKDDGDRFGLLAYDFDPWNNMGANSLRYSRQFSHVCPPSVSS